MGRSAKLRCLLVATWIRRGKQRSERAARAQTVEVVNVGTVEEAGAFLAASMRAAASAS